MKLSDSRTSGVERGGIDVMQGYGYSAPTALPYTMPALYPRPPLCSGHGLRTWRTNYGAVMICICCFCLYIIVQTFVSPRGKNIRLMVLIIGYSYSTEWMKNPAPFRSGMLAVCSSISDSGGRGRKITGYESNTVVEASSVWL